ncbi:DUF1127 domain-containing protein [Pseudogemmobacter sp. W21_MBD1_M6]|uniref:DUF1127 domain-containing protein n=1 Tax=Pseudogemmobacter sp. W21_MBD1_M6 TaxID=3240271 RepID=UPI003F9477D1
MATTANIRSIEAGIVERTVALFKFAADRYARYTVYRNTINELSALSDRDLSDLGLGRSMIKSVAYEAAYLA